MTRWLRAHWRRRPRPDDVDAELAFHVEMQTRRYVEAGWDPVSARRRALDRLGAVGDVQRECRGLADQMETDMRKTEWWLGIHQDVRYAARLLGKAPMFTAVALFMIALGVGASTAIFSVVNDVLLRRLPYQFGDRAVLVWNSGGPTGQSRTAVAAAEFADLRESPGVFDRVAAASFQPANLVGGCAGPGCEPENVNAYAVSPNLFDLLGALPQVGRPFNETDGADSAEKVVLLSDALWRRRFGADPSIVGRTIELGARVRTIIGVMPPDIRFPDAPLEGFRERADLWVPYGWEQARAQGRGNQVLMVLGRVRPGVPLRRAQADIDALADRFRAAYPDRYMRPGNHWRMATISLRDQMVGGVRPELLVLLGAVSLVLLIACANVANLMLARGRTRQRELAIRSALGAGRARLIRQLLVEVALIAGIGGTLGVLLAVAGVRALVSLDPTAVPHLAGPSVDAAVLAFAAAITLVTGLLVGLGPALRQSRIDPQAALAENPRGTSANPLRRPLRSLLVAAEVAMALVVLVGAGLLVRSFAAMTRIDVGFDPSRTLVLQLTLPRARYDSAAKLLAFYQALTERLAALPGASQVSAVYPMPMMGDGWSGSFDVEGLAANPGQPEPHAEYAVVLPRYFRTMGIPLMSGREFTADDVAGTPKVIIVDEDLARRYWPGEPAVGKRLNPNGKPGDWGTVVGVVKHVRNEGPKAAGEPQIYQPVAQRMEAILYFAVRTTGDPATLAGPARAAVTALDAGLPVGKLGTLPDLVAARFARERFTLLLFLIFGGVALTLAGVGLYGVMAFLVSQRRREIGVRLALGGQPGHVLRRVLAEGVTMAAGGLALGLACAIPLSRVLKDMLVGVTSTDPATYAAIGALLLAVAFVASYVPARRATRVNPVEVLRP
jgi:putative ABC transport system permease protein